jgi:hypothetical protein
MLSQVGYRRMFTRGGEVRAVAGTRDFGQPLRAATDRADLFAERRTPAPRLSPTAERTHHSSTIVFPQPLLLCHVWTVFGYNVAVSVRGQLFDLPARTV